MQCQAASNINCTVFSSLMFASFHNQSLLYYGFYTEKALLVHRSPQMAIVISRLFSKSGCHLIASLKHFFFYFLQKFGTRRSQYLKIFKRKSQLYGSPVSVFFKYVKIVQSENFPRASYFAIFSATSGAFI